MYFADILISKNSKLGLNANEFVKEAFSVDRFLSNNKSYELETVREDLGILLKALKKSMIKLINADYQDFIRLSTNLKDLKNNLKNLEDPFILLQSKMLKIEKIMTNHIMFLEALIDERYNLKVLRKKLFCLLNSKNYIFYFTKISEVERLSRYIHFKYYSKMNLKEYCIAEYDKKVIKVNGLLNEKLQSLFYDSITKSNQFRTYKILLVCSLLNLNSSVENIFKQKIVSKFVESEVARIIENKISKQSFSNFYKNLLDFIPLYMKELLFLTIYNKRIEGTNFLVNSFWIEVEKQLRNNLPLIFSPGNPELFMTRLESTEIFLKKFEKIFGDKKHIKTFRLNENTRKFLQCWNLNVYFQIRFQEILIDLEIVSQNIPKNFENPDLKKTKFNTIFVDRADKALIRCWSNGIFNSNLFAKFLKLSLQIISRVNVWARNISIWNTNSLIDIIIIIYADIDFFIKRISFYMEISQKQIPETLKPNLTTVSNCFQCSNIILLDLQFDLEEKIVKSLISESEKNLKYVADLTRIYRKTNREIPIERSSYVHKMNEPFEFFKKTYGSVFEETKLKEILKLCLKEVSNKYFNCINDVLLSIKRTEESLRRLKSVRAKSLNYTDTIQEQTFVADDDKIKMQLKIDVSYWTSKIKCHTRAEDVPNLQSLLLLVEMSNVNENI